MSRPSAGLALLPVLLLLSLSACESARTDASTTDQFTGFTESSPEWPGESLSESCADDPILCINQLERATIDIEDMVLMHCTTPSPEPFGFHTQEPQGLRRCTMVEAIGLVELDGDVYVYSPGLCDGTCRVWPHSVQVAASRVGVPYACGCPGVVYNSYSYCKTCGVSYRCDDAEAPWTRGPYLQPQGSEGGAGSTKSPVASASDRFAPCRGFYPRDYEYVRDELEQRALSCAVPASFGDSWRDRECMRLIPRELVPEYAADQILELTELAEHDDDWIGVRRQRVDLLHSLWERWQEDSGVRIPLGDWLEFEYRPAVSVEESENRDIAISRVRELLRGWSDDSMEGHHD